jgi:hypothetical protein
MSKLFVEVTEGCMSKAWWLTELAALALRLPRRFSSSELLTVSRRA